MYFLQTSNGAFSFGWDAKILWKHGINARSLDQQHDGKGRISIIVWGLAKSVIKEEGSPPLLGGAESQRDRHHRSNNNNGRGCRYNKGKSK